MLAAFTADVVSPFSFEDAAGALRNALIDMVQIKPSDEVLGLLLAKTALETGRWKKIHCYNFGNIKAGQKWAGMYTCILLNEVLNGKVVWFAPEGQLAGGPGTALVGTRYPLPPAKEPPEGYGHPQTRMRAYANKFDGAYDYVDFISQGRYAEAFKTLLTGDAVQWVHVLKRLGYFTADEATYARGVVSLQREFIGRLKGQTMEPVQLNDDVGVLARLCLARFQSEMLDRIRREERDLNLHGLDPEGGNSDQGSNA